VPIPSAAGKEGFTLIVTELGVLVDEDVYAANQLCPCDCVTEKFNEAALLVTASVVV
jgi:hypothetical protein